MTNLQSLLDASGLGEISPQDLGASHDQWHSRLVLGYVHQFHAIYGGDIDIINAAAIMCGLGQRTSDSDDGDSIERSVAHAKEILQRTEFPPEKIDGVLQVIRDLDKPEKSPETTEGRILKDADLLAGFGALGILRIALRTGETGGNIGRFLELTNSDLANRIERFEFPESKRSALKEKRFTDLLVALLDRSPNLEKRLPGRYIVLEGNSGVGKDTQAEALRRRFEMEDQESIVVKEPTDIYRSIDDCWKEKTGARLKDNGSMFRRFILIADRLKLIREMVVPALEEGINVISVRSYISMLVYQCQSEVDRALVAYLHQFVPIPDLVVLYDTSEEICFERIEERGTEGCLFDRLDQLRKYRPLYLSIVDSLDLDCPVETIDASEDENEVAELTWRVVERCL